LPCSNRYEHMNASTPINDNGEDRTQLHLTAALIAELGLSDVTVERIYEVMQSTGDSFVDAARRLAILQPEAIEQALYKVNLEFAPREGLIETAVRRVSTSRSLVRRQGERVVPSAELILAHDPDNPRSERLRALRTELLLMNEKSRGAYMIAVVSPGSGEGRSQLSGELALSFAQLGRRTLLVDADMRKPHQHVLFGSTNQLGLSQAIESRDAPYFNPVSGLPSMHLLTAGPIPPNPLELLSDGRFSNLLTTWRNSYEFIVFDTPPVSACADGLAVATVAAHALVLSRAQHTTYKSTRALMRRLTNTQSRLLGAVINHF
jgi:protein-tyrosine kinase